MKAFNFVSKISKKGLLIATGLLVVFGSVFAIPTTAVFAASTTPASYAALTKAYQDDQNWFKAQHVNVGRADTVVTQVQALITAAKSDGIPPANSGGAGCVPGTTPDCQGFPRHCQCRSDRPQGF